MLEWLEEKFPAPPLLPNDPTSKALVRSWVQLIASDTHPLQNLSAQERHSNDPVERKLWAQDWNLRGLSSFQKLIKGHSRTYCLGDQLTLADLCLIPQLYNARRFDVDLSELPELVRIESHCSQLKCYQESHPDRFQPPTITSS
jgi:maleylacetoacetate isomerase